MSAMLSWGKLLLCFCIAGIFSSCVLHAASYLSLELIMPYGYLNLSLISVILFWYLVDTSFHRREIYEFFGLYEGRLRLWLRMLRMLTLIFLILIAIAAVVNTKLDMLLTDNSVDAVNIQLNRTRSLVLLSGVALGALGWMYTNHQKQKSDRSTSTLHAIRDQMYDISVSNDYLKLVRLCSEIRESHNLEKIAPFDANLFNIKLSRYSDDDVNHNVTLEALVDRLLNTLNQLALGVRQGQFDYITVELVLRPRFIRHAYQFSEYILKETAAIEYIPKNWLEKIWYRNAKGRMISTKRTWEHFMWLAWKLPVLSTDQVEASQIVMPPRLKQGKKIGKIPTRKRKKKALMKANYTRWENAGESIEHSEASKPPFPNVQPAP